MSLLRKKKTIKLNKSLKKLHHRLSRIIFDQLSGSPIAQPSLYMKLTTLGPSSGQQQGGNGRTGKVQFWIQGTLVDTWTRSDPDQRGPLQKDTAGTVEETGLWLGH